MTAKEIAQMIPSLQAIALVDENIKETKKKKKDLVGLGVKNIVGTSLIRANAQIINDL